MTQVHASAVVADGAVLEPDVEVGPFSVVGPAVRLGRGTRVGSHCILEGRTTLGPDCVLTSHVAVGTAPQDLKYGGEPTSLEIGAANVFREFVTVNRGTAQGGGVTRIGDENLFMTGAHVAHDCQVGSRTVFANNATLGGHVHVADDATVGAFCAVHQFCRVGRDAFIGGFTVATKDVMPFMKTVGSRGEVRTYGPNRIGLERRGYPAEEIDALAEAWRVVRRSPGRTPESLQELARRHAGSAAVEALVSFIRAARDGRGVHS